MDATLRCDVCEFQHPGTLAEDVDWKKVQECLHPHVQYACRYWVSHLRHCTFLAEEVVSGLATEVYAFLKIHLLHWVEAMGLIRRLNEAIEGVIQLEQWLNDFEGEKFSVIKVRPLNRTRTFARLEKLGAYSHYRVKNAR
jgi:hypothetical protein